MKLVSFAVIAFLATTVSAGVSEIPGNSDYTAHQLEKRNPSESMHKQLVEEKEKYQKHYEDALGKYQDMKHREGELEARLSEIEFALDGSSYKPLGDELNHQCDRARIAYRTHREATRGQYKLMMYVKERLQEKAGDVLAWRYNQRKLEQHNEQRPNDLWTVTPPTHYNKEILAKQIADVCSATGKANSLENEIRTKSDELYRRLMAPGPDKDAIRGQYIETSNNLVSAKEGAWMKNVICSHMTALYTSLFDASK
ncbi:hypothetical protein BASA50_010109 [Batrachochytrium salamandrivorans]|uniref:DUF1311 domain-containing protein n=1 Tax=Batrachochytrium salamandrivorans TaxID=1357716 RepID=A0ABQ8F285_9FUNG|nr:hypothetical protein BASA50_010109 [Batrachochytrium salamandrivorans]KAH9246239.1 hypothetical protein BASA81_016228 [Batrachochytrium salamandrivorans]KAH9268116.1 hypothetical protein BASA83_009507 [Batrachochytrium salamandrivorans]